MRASSSFWTSRDWIRNKPGSRVAKSSPDWEGSCYFPCCFLFAAQPFTFSILFLYWGKSACCSHRSRWVGEVTIAGHNIICNIRVLSAWKQRSTILRVKTWQSYKHTISFAKNRLDGFSQGFRMYGRCLSPILPTIHLWSCQLRIIKHIPISAIETSYVNDFTPTPPPPALLRFGQRLGATMIRKGRPSSLRYCLAQNHQWFISQSCNAPNSDFGPLCFFILWC